MRRKGRPNRFGDDDDGSPRAQEDRLANRLGGRRVGGSGASMYSKADVRDVKAVANGEEVEFLVEAKQTIHASISVKWDWLRKITMEAGEVQKEPALSIEIRGGTPDGNCDRDWILIPVRVLEKLTKG